MRVNKLGLFAVVIITLVSASIMGAGIQLQLSGKGAVDETTIKVGEPVSIDIIMQNDAMRAGMTIGFKIVSNDIKTIQHVPDSSGLNERGDVKGHNGFEDATIWDLFGVMVVESDWDGKLPELLGFGALCQKKEYLEHDWERKLSFDIIVDQPGTIIIDSSYYPPGGKWLYASPPGTIEAHKPEWGGPYRFKVVK